MQNQNCSFFPGQGLTYKKIAFVRLKNYIGAFIFQNQIFGIETPMSVKRFEGRFFEDFLKIFIENF